MSKEKNLFIIAEPNGAEKTADRKYKTRIMQSLLTHGAGIGVELPDAIFDYDIDWSNICLIACKYNNDLVELITPFNWA